MLTYAVLIIPVLLGIVADSTDYLPAKMGVPLSCALIVHRNLSDRQTASQRPVLARRRFRILGTWRLLSVQQARQ